MKSTVIEKAVFPDGKKANVKFWRVSVLSNISLRHVEKSQEYRTKRQAVAAAKEVRDRHDPDYYTVFVCWYQS